MPRKTLQRPLVTVSIDLLSIKETLHLHNNEPGEEAPAGAGVAGLAIITLSSVLSSVTLLTRILGVPGKSEDVEILLFGVVLPDEGSIFVL